MWIFPSFCYFSNKKLLAGGIRNSTRSPTYLFRNDEPIGDIDNSGIPKVKFPNSTH